MRAISEYRYSKGKITPRRCLTSIYTYIPACACKSQKPRRAPRAPTTSLSSLIYKCPRDDETARALLLQLPHLHAPAIPNAKSLCKYSRAHRLVTCRRDTTLRRENNWVSEDNEVVWQKNDLAVFFTRIYVCDYGGKRGYNIHCLFAISRKKRVFKLIGILSSSVWSLFRSLWSYVGKLMKHEW